MSEGLDARVEAGIAILSVLAFIAILVVAGTMYEGATVAYAVVAAVVVFIVLMAGVGYWLSGKQGEN
jgi:predicted Na+-dependent transporter